jgi:hypothetical protein
VSTPLPHIGRPATGALGAEGIDSLEDVAGRSRGELLALHGVGPKAVGILHEALQQAGLSFRAETREARLPVDGWAIAMSFDGAESRPHVDRVAVRARIMFASFTTDGDGSNVNLTLDEQADFCARCPGFAPLDNGWGRRGWTAIDLTAAQEPDVRDALAAAYLHAL